MRPEERSQGSDSDPGLACKLLGSVLIHSWWILKLKIRSRPHRNRRRSSKLSGPTAPIRGDPAFSR